MTEPNAGPQFDRVTIVVDEEFGAKAAKQAALGPIWVVRSNRNERAIKSLWASSTFPQDHLTIFDGGSLPEACFLSILGTIDEHHFGWTKLDVVGITPSIAIENALGSYGAGTIQITENGFIFTRQAPAD